MDHAITPTLHPGNRRATRSALAEIPARMGDLAVTENARVPTPTFVPDTPVAAGAFLVLNNRPTSHLSACPSPEEMVIQQRGRRRLPVTWSPDIDSTKRQGPACKDRTPVKMTMRDSPAKTAVVVLRSTPRKRLHMGDTKDGLGSPDRPGRKSTSPTKKMRLERSAVAYTVRPATSTESAPSGESCRSAVDPTTFQTALKGLSQEQLVGVIEKLLLKHPYLEAEMAESLPAPDMKPLEERLKYLKKNIFKSLPNSRLTSKTDSPAYSRAATHVMDFKKCVLDQGRCLMESQHWTAVMDYVLLAWTYVKGTPLWDNPPHNAARKQCFKSLTAMAVTALRKGSWREEQLAQLRNRLYQCDSTSDDIQTCVNQVDSLLGR